MPVGAGRGLGRSFAQAALEQGDGVVGTVRRNGAMADLQRNHPDSVKEVLLDACDAAAVTSAVDVASQAFGGIDIVVNNAGAGLVGALEEVTEQRARGGGDIVQISTVGAIGSMPTFGLYNAGKWALEGFSEALSAEVSPFGIRVTIAQLGGFATDWAGSSMQFATPKAEYDELREAVFGTAYIPWPASDPDAPPTDADPRGAADALIAHLSDPDRPLRVLIGNDAREHAALAYSARRDSYGQRRDFNWPS